MARIVVKKRSSAVFDDELDSEELGMETEAEKQMKVILEKQLDTNLSIKQQFAQHRTFVTPSTYKSLTELVQGTCTYDKFKEIEQDQEVYQELQRCGLSEDEIRDYLAFKSGKKIDNRLVNPMVWNEKIERIEAKVKAHNEDLSKPQGFSNVKKLTRHEMDLEKTLYAGCTDKSKLAALISLNEDSRSNSCTDSAFAHIKNFSDKLQQKCRNKKRKKLVESVSSPNSIPDQNANFHYDPNIHHVVVSLDDDEISCNRLSTDEIRELPRFEHYKMGEPSRVLYIKNLHTKATDQELRSIFGRFEDENSSAIEYKICTGRMKGQAFIKFQDVEIARKALQFANGFILREKPIVIEFGKKS